MHVHIPKALVFGATGALGQEVCTALENRGWIVRRSRIQRRKDYDQHRGEWNVDPDTDAVVNCTGYSHAIKPLEDISADDIVETYDANFLNTWIIMRAALPVMKKRKKGIIINVASKAAAWPVPGLSVYSAMKAAVVALTECAGKELKKDFPEGEILCVTVCPAGMNTPMRERLYGKRDSEKQQSPKRVADVIAKMVDQRLVTGSETPLEQGEMVVVLKDQFVRRPMSEWSMSEWSANEV